MKTGDVVKIAIGVVLVVTLLLGLIFIHAAQNWLMALMDWVEGLGLWGILILVVLYVLTAMFAIPGATAVLGFWSGFLYFFPLGFPSSYVGTLSGAIFAFLFGKTVFRSLATKCITKGGNLEALDKMVKDKGFVTVLLCRLAIFPPNIMNYFFSITAVNFIPYFLGTAIGILPGVLTLVLLGSSVHKCGCSQHVLWEKITAVAALVVTVILSILITIWARRELKRLKNKVQSVSINDGNTGENESLLHNSQQEEETHH